MVVYWIEFVFLEKALALQTAENTKQIRMTPGPEVKFSRLDLLHRIIQKIPYDSSWASTLETLELLLQNTGTIAAFELAYFSKQKIQLIRATQKQKINRQESFNEQKSLIANCLRQKKSLVIGNFNDEYRNGEGKSLVGSYPSIIITPFELAGIQQLLLIVYSLKEEAFDLADQQMLELLTKHLSLNIIERLGD